MAEVKDAEFIVTGDGASITFSLRLHGTRANDDLGFKWYQGNCEFSLDKFIGRFAISFTDRDLRTIRDGLNTFVSGNIDDVEVGNLEDDFSLRIKRSKTGADTIESRLTPGGGYQVFAKFTFESDDHRLRQTVSSLDDVLVLMGE